MVRLGALPEKKKEVLNLIFQFQYGTIGGRAVILNDVLWSLFQFQYGTIGGAA